MAFKLNALLLFILASSLISFGEASVSYDHKAITINGQRRILLSGSIHYPRSTPEVFSSNVFLGCFYFVFLSNGLFQVSTFVKKRCFLFCFVWITEFEAVFVVVLDVARSYPEG